MAKVTTLYDVKFASNRYLSVSPSAPDNTFDSTEGYTIGYLLLVTDGTSYECTSDVVGSAVWEQETKYDFIIEQAIENTQENLFIYLNNWFTILNRQYTYFRFDVEFELNTIVSPTDNFEFYPGDLIKVTDSSRNDGIYTVVSSDGYNIVVEEDFPLLIDEDNYVYIECMKVPVAVSIALAQMVAYDTFSRDNRDLSSESIGNYSYTKSDTIGYFQYPNNIVGNLYGYKRPRYA